MGEEQKVGYEELLASSRAAFDASTDFTLAVEEEFALLDPATLELVNRFEEVQEAARGTEIEPHLVGELIASEAEVRTGRCETFAEAAEKLGERRAQLRALTDGIGVGLVRRARIRGAGGRTSASSTRRTTVATTSCCVTSSGATTRSACTCTSGSTAPTARSRCTSALRNYLPELLALSASSPFVEGVFTHLHSARTQIFTRMFPRCGIPDSFDGLGGVGDVPPLPLRDGLGHGAHADLVERPRRISRSRRSRSASATRSPISARRARSWRSVYSLTARIARAIDEGEPLPDWPHRLLEENLWRALRWGLSGELIDLERGRVDSRTRAARAAARRGCSPSPRSSARRTWLAIPERNAAERQIARHAEGASIEEIFAEQVGAGDRVSG